MVRESEDYGRTRSERRALRRRWRKNRDRTFPSQTAALDYLRLFPRRGSGEPARAAHGLYSQAHRGLAGFGDGQLGLDCDGCNGTHPKDTATLDMDATLAETWKRQSLFCYKKFKAYQPLNIYWAEQGLVVYSEFRDGNVPANYELLGP